MKTKGPADPSPDLRLSRLQIDILKMELANRQAEKDEPRRADGYPVAANVYYSEVLVEHFRKTSGAVGSIH